MADTALSLRDIGLGAVGVKELHPAWTDIAIEDYLNKFENEVILSSEVDILISLITETKRRSYFYARVY